jgi:hypothetical protein
VADAGEIAPLIRSLCLADAAKRAIAAAEIFTGGYEMARAATQEWLAYSPLASLLMHGPSGALEITVGIAVEPDTFARVRSANESPRLANVPPDQDAKEFELGFPGGLRLDILTTRQPGGAGAIARYLLKFGEGIQQVEINVTDVGGATEILRDRFALEPVYPATRAGADGTRVNFFLVPRPGGAKVLIELVEPAAKS